MVTKVRWGLLSTARINRRLIPAIRASKRGELVAVASRSAQKSAEYAGEWKIPQSYGSYEAMLASDAVDAVYISLPNHMHAEWAVRALDAGKHVLCEKPFAISIQQIDQMIAAQQRSGLVLQEAFMYRHHPQTKRMNEMMRDGELGEVLLVRSHFSFFMEDRSTNVRMVPEYGGGSLWDVGIYPLSLAQMVFGGLPETVNGQQWIGDTGIDDVFAGQLHYSGGRTAQISSGFQIPYETSAEIHGTKGRLTINRPFVGSSDRESKMVFTSADGQSKTVQVPKTDAYECEVENMNDAILDGVPTLVTLEESRKHVQVAVALYESARTGQPVILER